MKNPSLPAWAIMALAIALSCLGFTAAFAEKTGDDAEKRPGQAFCVIGYLPSYRVDRVDLNAIGGLVTDLIYFSFEPKPNGELNVGRINAATLRKLHDMKRQHKNRLWFALGGWGRSQGFAPVATEPKARQRFVVELTKFCQENQFDGADFDWEFPKNQKEEEAYAALLTDVKRAFGPKKLLLSLTIAPRQKLGAAAYEAADRVQLMSYDRGAQHSTFEHAKADVDALMKQGVAPAKLFLGVPFYGRGVKSRSVVRTYADLVRKHQPAPETDEVEGLYFNGITTIQKKTRWAVESGLGGVMIWELGQDTTDRTSLLQAIRQVVPIRPRQGPSGSAR